MGGYGSGRRPTKTSLGEARLLAIGELCDAGRAQRRPQSEITWPRSGGPPRAHLRYTISEEQPPQGASRLILALRYQPYPGGQESRQRIILERTGAGAYRARCASSTPPAMPSTSSVAAVMSWSIAGPFPPSPRGAAWLSAERSTSRRSVGEGAG